jgi:hypothetical protein
LHLLPALIVALAAAPALAQQSPDPLQKFYGEPLKRLYEDPMKKYFPDPTPPGLRPPPSAYPSNPLIPGGQPRAPRTFNQSRSAPGTAPELPPGMVTGAQPYGNQPEYDSRFRHFDANNDGQLSRDEYLRSNMQRAPVNPSVRDLGSDSLRRRFDSRFAGTDANRDGRVTRQEYDAARNPRF